MKGNIENNLALNASALRKKKERKRERERDEYTFNVAHLSLLLLSSIK